MPLPDGVEFAGLIHQRDRHGRSPHHSFNVCPTSSLHSKDDHSAQARQGRYTSPKALRPSALLNTLGKIIDAVTAQYLQDVAERWPATQMGARKHPSTETAQDWLLSRIRTVWEEGTAIATVLSLDTSAASRDESQGTGLFLAQLYFLLR